MAEWLYEAGIGENRAALVENGAIVEALVEVDDGGPKAGLVDDAILRSGRIAELRGGAEILLDAVPTGLAEGARFRARVVREALAEPGKPKRAKARAVAAETPLAAAATLRERIADTGVPVRELAGDGRDALEGAGWGELIEQAASGFVDLPGGALRISLTPAMTLFDIDADDPAALATVAAREVARAIRRFGIAGNIGVDFPSLGGRAQRLALAAAFAAEMTGAYEATAINGFGFMQIVRPRERASLLEIVQYDRAGAAARALLGQAERSGLHGAVRLTARPSVVAVLAAHRDWLDRLAGALGGAVALKEDASLAISAGHVAKA